MVLCICLLSCIARCAYCFLLPHGTSLLSEVRTWVQTLDILICYIVDLLHIKKTKMNLHIKITKMNGVGDGARAGMDSLQVGEWLIEGRTTIIQNICFQKLMLIK